MTISRDPAPDQTDRHMITVNRWRRYGRDRLYVAQTTGAADAQRDLGFRDLIAGTDHPVTPETLGLLTQAADDWARTHQPTVASPAAVVDLVAAEVPSENGPAVRPWRDLSSNRPGESAQRRADDIRSKAPLRHALSRLLMQPTADGSWRVGARGERLVADELRRLSERDRRWTSLHSVPVGDRGSDIDHLVIGPGGVFTLNTKHHRDASIWVSGDTFMVNGTKVPHIRNARHEAERAGRLLSAAVGRTVLATGLVVPVGCTMPLTIRTQPRRVHVVPRHDLVTWLSSHGQILDVDELGTIWEMARRSTTWER